MKDWIRRLIRWACPELFAQPLTYHCIEGDVIVFSGQFLNLRGYWQAPWQITLPAHHRNDGLDRPAVLPWEFETYYRRRGSLDPLIYEALVQPARPPRVNQ